MVDPYLRLNSSLDSRTLHSFVMLAGRCLQYDPHARPPMAAVCAELKHLMANDTSTDGSHSVVAVARREGEEVWGGGFFQSNSSESAEAQSVVFQTVPNLSGTAAYNGHPDPTPPSPYLPRTSSAPHPNHTYQMSPPTLPSRPASPQPRPSSTRPQGGGRSSPTAGRTRARLAAVRSDPSSPVRPRQQVEGGEEGVQTAMDKWDEIRKVGGTGGGGGVSGGWGGL